MDQALFCKSCGFRLSRPLRPITTLADRDRICLFDSEGAMTPVPTGYALIIDGDILHEMQSQLDGPGQAATSWLNLADLMPGVGYTTDRRRLSGCCGPSGIDGPNRICVCDAEIGTEQSDCWTWHIFIPLAENTIWKEP